jgi:hypothetical protein
MASSIAGSKLLRNRDAAAVGTGGGGNVPFAGGVGKRMADESVVPGAAQLGELGGQGMEKVVGVGTLDVGSTASGAVVGMGNSGEVAGSSGCGAVALGIDSSGCVGIGGSGCVGIG